jgi:hypothetical protein
MYKLEPTIENLELSSNLFNDEMLEYNEGQIGQYLTYLLDQQLGNKNNVSFTPDPGDDVLPYVTCIICKNNTALVRVEYDGIASNIEMSQGDLLVFPSELKHQFRMHENLIIKKMAYSKNVDNDPSLTKYTVSVRLIDEYEIDVHALSEEDAINKAKDTRISKWKHLDLYPDVQERKIIRYAKWHNFEIKDID